MLEKKVNAMLCGDALNKKMSNAIAYDDSIRRASPSERLLAMSDVYDFYFATEMSREIYTKLYLALIRSLRKKETTAAIRQRYQNKQMILQHEYNSVLGGADSFTILGTSGIGKSRAINRAVELISEHQLLVTRETKIIMFLTVQCMFDSSVKGLLLEILRRVDELLDTKYYANAIRYRFTTDMLIGSVSNVCINHIGVLIVDEIQNIVSSKNGKSIVCALTQLINNSGISICMVGTPECATFFDADMKLARRSLGLSYSHLEYNQSFSDLCSALFRYQYMEERAELTDGMTAWLYEHSGGITSVVISLFLTAQEIGIERGQRKIDISLLNDAYTERHALLRAHLAAHAVSVHQKSRAKDVIASQLVHEEYIVDAVSDTLLSDIATIAKNTQADVVNLLYARGVRLEEI